MKKRFLILILTVFIVSSQNLQKLDGKPVQDGKIDYILVKKGKRLLSLYSNGLLVKQYSVALGFTPVGKKRQRGDGKTPEGCYTITYKNPQSIAHLSLRLSYPSESDIAFARANNLDPGSDIMIHGIKKNLTWLGKYHHFFDWTQGCIAVSNTEIEEIYSLVQEGTKVEIIK